MIKHGHLAEELRRYYGTHLGCRAQTYDACGLAASPDPEAGITDNWLRDVRKHRRVRAALALLPLETTQTLETAYQTRRPLPIQVSTALGSDELARVIQTLVGGRDVVRVATGPAPRRKALLDRARVILDAALASYSEARRC